MFVYKMAFNYTLINAFVSFLEKDDMLVILIIRLYSTGHAWGCVFFDSTMGWSSGGRKCLKLYG